MEVAGTILGATSLTFRAFQSSKSVWGSIEDSWASLWHTLGFDVFLRTRRSEGVAAAVLLMVLPDGMPTLRRLDAGLRRRGVDVLEFRRFTSSNLHMVAVGVSYLPNIHLIREA